MTTNAPLALTVEEVADALQVSLSHVYRLIKKGDIPLVPLEGPKRVSRAWLERCVNLGLASGVASHLQGD